MKKHYSQSILFIVLILWITTAKAQFEKCSVLHFSSTVVQVTPFGNNFLVSSECRDNASVTNEIMSIDLNGNVQWSMFTDFTYLTISNFVTDGDSVFYFMSIDSQCETVSGASTLIKFNSEGEIIWQQEFPYDFNSEFFNSADMAFTYHLALMPGGLMAIATDHRVSFFDMGSMEFISAIDIGQNDASGILAESDTTLVVYGESFAGRINIIDQSYTAFTIPGILNSAVLSDDGFAVITGSDHLQLRDSEFNLLSDYFLAGETFVPSLYITNSGVIVAISTESNGFKTALAFSGELQNPIQEPLHDSDLMEIRSFCLENSFLIVGGSSKALTNNSRRHVLKSYDMVNTIIIDYTNDVGVTDFTLTDYHFIEMPNIPGNTVLGLAIEFDVELTAYGFNTVDHCSFYFEPTFEYIAWCDELYFTHINDTPILPGQPTSVHVPMTSYAEYVNPEPGQPIELEICLNTLGPNHQLDDSPANDSYCETFTVIYTATEEHYPDKGNIFFNASTNELKMDLPEAGELSVYSIDGMLIMDRTISKTSTSLAIPELPVGIYMARFRGEQTTILTRFFKN